MAKNNIKTTWQRVRLGDFASINPAVQLQRGKEYPFMDMANVAPLSRTTDWREHKVFTGSGARFQEGDTLFARITPCLENGKITQALKISGSCFGSAEFYVLRGKEKVSDSDFIFYLTRTYRIRKLAEASMIGASGRQRVERAAFENIEVEIPEDINTQKRIAGILSAFDGKIELNNKISKNLEQIAQAIFKEWLLKNQKSNLKNQKYEVKKIGDVAKVVLGGTPSRLKKEYWGGNIPWINSGKVNEFRIISASENITSEGLKKSNTQLMPKRTTVIAITGATLGQVSLLEIEACANQSVVGIFGSELLSPEFIYLFIKNNILEIIQEAAGGAQQHINKGVVENYPVIVPPKESMVKFNEIIKPMFDRISKNIFENQKLAALRDLLLHKLMSGEIRA